MKWKYLPGYCGASDLADLMADFVLSAYDCPKQQQASSVCLPIENVSQKK
jgi:hypothetical protein